MTSASVKSAWELASPLCRQVIRARKQPARVTLLTVFADPRPSKVLPSRDMSVGWVNLEWYELAMLSLLVTTCLGTCNLALGLV